MIMKKILKYLFLSIISLSSISSISPLSARAEKNHWADFKRYAADNQRVIENGDTLKVVLFGNSITDSWPSMRPDFFKDNGLIGRGISGQSTYQFLSRFREDVVNLHPRIVVINGATNDVAENSHPYSEEKTLGNIRSMVEIARANGIGVILTSTLPAAGFKWNPSITDAPEKIQSLNSRIKAMAKDFGIPYVDYHPVLLAPDGRSLKSDLSPDGVHPNAEGYKLMEETLLPAIQNYNN